MLHGEACVIYVCGWGLLYNWTSHQLKTVTEMMSLHKRQTQQQEGLGTKLQSRYLNASHSTVWEISAKQSHAVHTPIRLASMETEVKFISSTLTSLRVHDGLIQ